MAKPPSSVRSVRLPDETWERIGKAALEREMKINAAMAEAISRWLDGPPATVRVIDDEEPLNHPPMADVVSRTMRSRAETIAELPPARQMTEREARDAFWRKTGAFNPKGKTK